MDPVRNMLADAKGTQNEQKPVTVEEGMDCREANMRFFSIKNHISKLSIILSRNSAILSCKLDGREIIVDQKCLHQMHETWALGDRPYQRMSALAWNCHVRGTELLLSASNGTSTIHNELTRSNELISLVKLKSIHLQQQVFYFNLNDAKTKSPIDGHTLVVQCNGNMNRIKVQNTKLLCQCNKSSSVLPQSLIGDIPFELVRHDSSVSPNSSDDNNDTCASSTTASGVNNDDLIICDAIFSLESTCALDVIRVELRYGYRSVVLEIKTSGTGTTTGIPTLNSQATQKTNVSSSTSASTTSQGKPDNLSQSDRLQTTQQATCSSTMPPTENNDSCDSKATRDWFSPAVDSSIRSSSSSMSTNRSDQPTESSLVPTSSSNVVTSPSITLRARVRVTNFGVCMMPIMMTNYSCKYSFVW